MILLTQSAQLVNFAPIVANKITRPLRIISGEIDPIFPIDSVIEQYDLLQDIYQVFDAEQQCWLGIHPDGHRPDYGLMAEGVSME